MLHDRHPDERDGAQGSEGPTFTRRSALAMLGASGVAGAISASGEAAASHGTKFDPTRRWNQHVDAQGHDLKNLHAADVDHVFTAARAADRIVWKDDDGVFHADGPAGEVASGEDVIDVAQAAVDSLTDGRDWKETVAIVSPGTVGEHDEAHELVLPSYTVLDAPTTITIEDSDPYEVIPMKARDAHHVEVRNLTVRGFPAYCGVFNSVSNLTLANITLEIDESGPGTGIRVDGGGDSGERSQDIRASGIYGEQVGYHLFETRRCDRVQVSEVVGKNIVGCAVLFNETADATASDVIEYSPDPPTETRYATFRNTYQEGRVTADNIVSHDAKRGLHIHTGSGDVVINNVYIDGARHRGASISGPPNTVINGGVIKNCTGNAIDIYNVYDPVEAPERRADGIDITNLRIFDDRPEGERTQEVAISEGPNAQNNRIVDNDVRGGGTEALIESASPSTVVADNVGDGVASGTATLSAGASPAARVEGVSGHGDVTLALRSKAVSAPPSAFRYDHHFEWTGSQWDLVFEWATDPGVDLTVDYIVDRPQANLGRYPKAADPLTEGTYRIEAGHSGKVAEVADGATASGANVQQGTYEDATHQQWAVTSVDGVENGFRFEAVHSGKVAEVADGSTEDGATIQQGEWSGADHQTWRVEPLSSGTYNVTAVHSGQSWNVAGGDQNDGANVVQWPFSGGAGNEIWRFESV